MCFWRGRRKPGARSGRSIRLNRFTANLLAILGFVFAVVLVGVSPPLFAVFGAIVVLGVVLVTVGGFDTGSEEKREDPIEVLQARYARGEIDEAEFERRLDRIMDSNEAAGRDADRESIDATSAEPVSDPIEGGEFERENA